MAWLCFRMLFPCVRILRRECVDYILVDTSNKLFTYGTKTISKAKYCTVVVSSLTVFAREDEHARCLSGRENPFQHNLSQNAWVEAVYSMSVRPACR